jgi:purine-binding chemotaxis protein CheW
VNLRARFGFDRLPYDARTRLIVVQQDGRSVGLIVDAAREFVTIAPGVIQPPAEGLTGTSGRYLQGVATLGERMILILDIPELLNNDELATAGATEALRLSQEK